MCSIDVINLEFSESNMLSEVGNECYNGIIMMC